MNAQLLSTEKMVLRLFRMIAVSLLLIIAVNASAGQSEETCSNDEMFYQFMRARFPEARDYFIDYSSTHEKSVNASCEDSVYRVVGSAKSHCETHCRHAESIAGCQNGIDGRHYEINKRMIRELCNG